jgi:hypothetical protein
MAQEAPLPHSSDAHPPQRERRQYPRAIADWPLFVSLSSRTGTTAQKHEPARLRDVSRAGLSFYMDRPLAMMSVLALDLDLPMEHGVRHVRGQGAVVRCERISAGVEHYEIAVFLHDMAEPDRRAIDEYVRQRAPAAKSR